MKIRDLIYFDQDKAASLYSQLHSGIVEHRTETTGLTKDSQVSGEVGVSVIKSRGQYIKRDIESASATYKAYHNVLLDVETTLEQLELILDINNQEEDIESDTFRNTLKDVPYLRVSGRAIFEDYSMLKAMTEQMHRLAGFVSRCSALNGELSSEVATTLEGLERCFRDLRHTTEEKEKYKILKKIDETQRHFDKQTESELGNIPSWLTYGIAEWIQHFSLDRVVLKIQSSQGVHGTFIANLNASKIMTNDLSHVMYSYGQETNLPLTMLGIVTSVPNINSLDDGSGDENGSVSQSGRDMSHAFEGVFESMRSIYEIMNPVKYPRIALDPIAIYRDIRPNH